MSSQPGTGPAASAQPSDTSSQPLIEYSSNAFARDLRDHVSDIMTQVGAVKETQSEDDPAVTNDMISRYMSMKHEMLSTGNKAAFDWMPDYMRPIRDAFEKAENFEIAQLKSAKSDSERNFMKRSYLRELNHLKKHYKSKRDSGSPPLHEIVSSPAPKDSPEVSEASCDNDVPPTSIAISTSDAEAATDDDQDSEGECDLPMTSADRPKTESEVRSLSASSLRQLRDFENTLQSLGLPSPSEIGSCGNERVSAGLRSSATTVEVR